MWKIRHIRRERGNGDWRKMVAEAAGGGCAGVGGEGNGGDKSGGVPVHRGWRADLPLKGVKGSLASRFIDKLEGADCGGRSSAATPWCPVSVARSSGVSPS